MDIPVHIDEHIQPLKVMVVDDQKEMRLGLTLILNKSPHIEVIGSAAHGQELLEMLEHQAQAGDKHGADGLMQCEQVQHEQMQCVHSSPIALAQNSSGASPAQGLPDVIVMDVRMPVMDGIEATRQLSARFPSIKVLVLTTYDQNDYAFGALDAGASGFLLKDARASELRSAVLSVGNGDAILTPRITKELLSKSPLFNKEAYAEQQQLVHLFEALTDREKEICSLVADGFTNAEIADKIVVQPASVKKAITRILAKLEMRDRVQLAIAWHKSGL